MRKDDREKKLERWLVIFNCQTLGVANSLAVINPDVSVDSCDIWKYKNEINVWQQKINDYDHIILHDDVKALQLIDFSSYLHTEVLAISFRAYHPDLCYANSNGQPVKTTTSDYNSIICLTAYQKGLTKEEAETLYQRKIYEQLGYFDRWVIEKNKIHADFERHGYDLAPYFSNWGRHSAFMYSINHPKMICLFDLASMITQKMGRPVRRIPSEYYPYDNIQAGPIFAIYPEIAQHYGVEGSYLFKPPGSNSLQDLRSFIASSYASYSNYEKGSVLPNEDFMDAYNTLCQLL